MPPKSKSKAKGAASSSKGQNKKISAFFKPDLTRKRCSERANAQAMCQLQILFFIIRSHSVDDDDPQTTPPPAKRPTDKMTEGEPSKSSTPPTPDSLSEAGGAESLSPEQKERMALKKLEAETKRIAAVVGTEKLGPSWIKALLSEFKKPYIKEVHAIMFIINVLLS
jgi:hypothetical protein